MPPLPLSLPETRAEPALWAMCSVCLTRVCCCGKPLPAMPCRAWPRCPPCISFWWRPWWLFFPPAATRHLFVHHRVVLSPDVGAEALLRSLRAVLSAYCCVQPHAVMSLGLCAGVACSRRRKHLSGRGWRGGGFAWETARPFGAKPCSSLRRKHPLPFGSQAGNKV